LSVAERTNEKKRIWFLLVSNSHKLCDLNPWHHLPGPSRRGATWPRGHQRSKKIIITESKGYHLWFLVYKNTLSSNNSNRVSWVDTFHFFTWKEKM